MPKGNVYEPSIPIYAWERKAARERDGFVCQYCDSYPEFVTTDHITPEARGGTDDRHNLVCACADCNCRKAMMTPQEWYERLVNEFNESWSISERLYRRIGNLQTRFKAWGPVVQAALPLDAPPAPTGKIIRPHSVFAPSDPGGKFDKYQGLFPFMQKRAKRQQLAA